MLSLRMRARLAVTLFTPSTRRILLHSMLLGLAISIADLLFNFYLVSLGYAADTAGYLSTISRMAGVVMSLPIGLLIDRIGARRAVLLGALLYGAGWGLLLLSSAIWTLVLFQFMIGGAQILAQTAVVPLLAETTPRDQRPTLFGFNASASLIVGLLGSLIGGILPALLAGLIGSGPTDMAAYRAALASVVVLGIAALLPLRRHLPLISEDAEAEQHMSSEAVSTRTLLRYALASLLLGVGGGALLPFQNLFFRQQFSLSDPAVGTLLAWSALGMGLGGIMGGSVSRRLGLQRAAMLLRLGAVPAMLLMLIPALIPATIGFFLRGLFVAASYPLNDALVMQLTPARQRGIAISLLSMLWSLGWAGTAAISGWVQLRWGFGPVLLAAAGAYLLSGLAIGLLKPPARLEH